MDRKLNRAFERFRMKGDVAALATVFDRSSTELAAVARHLTSDAASAEDIVQATYVTAIEKSPSFDGSLPVMPWLLGILGNHAAKARRRAARVPDPSRLQEPSVEDPVDVAERGEFGGLVREHIHGLPETYSNAVADYLLEGLAPREIGRRLGITAGAASQRLHRGLNLLRKSLPASAAYGVTPIGLDLAGMRERLLSGTDRTAQSAALGGATSATSTIGALMLIKQPVTIAAAVTLLGLGAWTFLPDGLEGPTSSTDPEVQDTTTASAENGGLLPVPSDTVANDRVPPADSQRVAELPAVSAAPIDWLTLINEAPNRVEARKVITRITDLEPRAGLQVIETIYADIEQADRRRECFMTFARNGHELAHHVLDIGTRDAEMDIQSSALSDLSDLAFIDFQADFPAYGKWKGEVHGVTFGAALEFSAEQYMQTTRRLDGAALVPLLDRFDEPEIQTAERAGVDLKRVLLDAGAAEEIERWFGIDDRDARRTAMRWSMALERAAEMREILVRWLDSTDVEKVRAALGFLRETQLDEEFLRARILPIVQQRASQDSGVLSRAIDLLGQKGNDWAIPTLLDVLTEPSTAEKRPWFSVSRSLAAIGNPEVIPSMIAVIQADNSYDTVYGVGYFGLGKLTGVKYDESHDGQFWLDWWDANKGRFPDEVANMPLPYVDLGND